MMEPCDPHPHVVCGSSSWEILKANVRTLEEDLRTCMQIISLRAFLWPTVTSFSTLAHFAGMISKIRIEKHSTYVCKKDWRQSYISGSDIVGVPRLVWATRLGRTLDIQGSSLER